MVIREIDKETLEMVTEIIGDHSASAQILAKYDELTAKGETDLVIGVCLDDMTLVLIPRSATTEVKDVV